MMKMKSAIFLRFIVGFSILALAITALALEDWQSEDIGDTAAGATDIVGEEITIVANGADIWAAADACRYVYKEVTGDFEISARIVSMERANEWTKAGLMARQSLEPNSQHAFIALHSDHGVKMIHRDAPGANTGPEPWEKNFDPPIWIKLVRTGNEFTTFWSETGKDGSWQPADVPGCVGTATIEMDDTILIGIAATSHVAGTMTTVVVDDIKGSSNILPVEPAGCNIATWAEVKIDL